MERIAVFSDVHGNLPALQAVWVDMDKRGVGRRYCLGDLVGYGAEPNEVIAFLREHGVPTLMGNDDKRIGFGEDLGVREDETAVVAQALAWTEARLKPENKVYLRNLPLLMTVLLGRRRVVLAHGSLHWGDVALSDEAVVSLLGAVGADVLVCGQTHKPCQREVGNGRLLLNAGSVGQPLDGDPHARYIFLAVAGNDIRVEFVRVGYDVERAAKAIEATKMPHEYAQMLRFGAKL